MKILSGNLLTWQRLEPDVFRMQVHNLGVTVMFLRKLIQQTSFCKFLNTFASQNLL